MSTTTVKLAMISYETQSKITWDGDTIVDNPAAARLLKRAYRGPWKRRIRRKVRKSILSFGYGPTEKRSWRRAQRSKRAATRWTTQIRQPAPDLLFLLPQRAPARNNKVE